jgi:hypothetical protein
METSLRSKARLSRVFALFERMMSAARYDRDCCGRHPLARRAGDIFPSDTGGSTANYGDTPMIKASRRLPAKAVDARTAPLVRSLRFTHDARISIPAARPRWAFRQNG